jgi:hypothetical protein
MGGGFDKHDDRLWVGFGTTAYRRSWLKPDRPLSARPSHLCVIIYTAARGAMVPFSDRGTAILGPSGGPSKETLRCEIAVVLLGREWAFPALAMPPPAEGLHLLSTTHRMAIAQVRVKLVSPSFQ